MNIANIIDDFYRNEIVITGKLFSRYLHWVNPEVEQDFILACSYVRSLDDLVDSGLDLKRAETELEQQRNNLSKTLNGLSINTEDKYSQILSYLQTRYDDRLFEVLQTAIEAINTDNKIIKSGEPLTNDELRKRHVFQTLPCFQAISLIVNGKILRYSPGFKDLMFTWATYDSLMDIEDDLSVGLMLFSKEDLNEHNIKLIPRQPLPDQFQNYTKKKKIAVASALTRQSSAVYETNLPQIQQVALQFYFISRSIKLSIHGCQFPPSLKYRCNLLSYDSAVSEVDLTTFPLTKA